MESGTSIDKSIIETDSQYSTTNTTSFHVYDFDKIKIQFLFKYFFDIRGN
ncbi:MAG: hypothetical protein H0X03_07855 [Nitrosopumilus sp.]|nr:hypothetical protein [Nitrosopumilus sp.]